MACLSCLCSTKAQIFASLPKNSTPQVNRKPPVRRINPAGAAPPPPTVQQQQPPQKQPSVAEIERAIGAGIFRNSDTASRDSEQGKTLFDAFLSNTIGETEGSVEKKLRETGEWIIDRSDAVSRSTGPLLVQIVLDVRSLPNWHPSSSPKWDQYWEENFNGCVPRDATDVDFVLPCSFWVHKTTLQHAVSG